MPDPTRSQPPKLLQEIRTVRRLHHYSIHTERAYVEWVADSFVSTACDRVRTSSLLNPRLRRS
jgi:hypothetical protein